MQRLHCNNNVKPDIADQKYPHGEERAYRENKTVPKPVNQGAKLGNMQSKDFRKKVKIRIALRHTLRSLTGDGNLS